MSTALALLALGLPIVAAFAMLPAMPRSHGHRFEARVAAIALAAGLGLGLSSTAYFLALLLFDGGWWSVALFDIVTLAAGAAAWRRRGGDGAPGARGDALGDRVPPFLWSFFVAVLLASFAGFVLAAIREPHGAWDAWAIWNAKARFLARAGSNWRVLFLDEVAPPDYPLLLPAAVARAWSYAGEESPLVSIVVAGLFAVATIALLTAAVSILRGRAQGIVGGLVLAPLLLAEAPSQYADVPLAFFILATVVLLALHDRFDPSGRSLPVLAGLTAGMAAWTKNEGLAFFFMIVAVRSFGTLRDGRSARWRSLAWFSIAGAPFLLFNAILRLWLLESAAPITFLRVEAVRAQLFDPAHYWQVIVTVAGQRTPATVILLSIIVWAAMLGLVADRELRRLGRTGLSALVLLLAAFFLVYVVTPHNLAWHVSTTLSRLMIQITPLAIFAVLLVTRSVDDMQPPSAVVSTDRTKVPTRKKERT